MPKETNQVKVRDHFHSKAHIAHSPATPVLSPPPLVPRTRADTFLCTFHARWDRRAILYKWIALGAEDEEQKRQGGTEESALAVHVFRHGVERKIQKAEPQRGAWSVDPFRHISISLHGLSDAHTSLVQVNLLN